MDLTSRVQLTAITQYARKVIRAMVKQFLPASIFIALLSAVAFKSCAQPISLTTDNSASGVAPTWRIPAPVYNKGVLLRAIRSMSVLNASPGAHPTNGRSRTLDQVRGRGNNWTVVNGGFSYWPIYQGRAAPFSKGMVIRNDIVEAVETCSHNAGAVVIRGNTVIVARSGANNLSQAHARFGRSIQGFIGCGVLLIQNGQPLDSRDLINQQGFSFDLDSNACRRAQHTLIGIRKGVAYVIFNPGTDTRKWLSCRQYRDLLKANGFGALVKLDGSSGFFYKDSASSAGKGYGNPTGLFIHEW